MAQENTLFGNIRHNTQSMLEQAKKSAGKKSRRSLKRLLQTAREHVAPFGRDITRRLAAVL